MADDKLDQIKKLLDGDRSNVNQEYNVAAVGLNLDNSVNQVPKGMLTYALNASVENFDSNSINYQNEPGNEPCYNANAEFYPAGHVLIGKHFIQEKNKHIFFLTNPATGDSQIGYMDNNDCNYHTLINAKCLNFNIAYPIHKVVHKITNCSTEIYWTDGFNPRRYLDLDPLKIPRKLVETSTFCSPDFTDELDCNQLKLQPNFSIPGLTIVDVVTGGSLTAGTVQFAIQYSDSASNPYTSYYSVTNPTPIADPRITTPDFNYPVGKSVVIEINNLDTTGQFQYFNLAVIKTINSIASVELIGTYFIDTPTKQITYTGQDVSAIRLAINDIFEKYPYYDIAQDVTAVQDILVWDNLSSIDRINYQQIANQVSLGWQTYRIPANENYADEINATNLRGYLRDEVYAFEIVFLLRNGKQTDGFHIPGKRLSSNDIFPDVPDLSPDFVGTPEYVDPLSGIGYSPYWKIYNTAYVTGDGEGLPIGNATPYKQGEFAYWESKEKYPCNVDLWGDLADQPIRHHKFPDVLVSPIFESATPTITSNGKYHVEMQNNDAVFPIGVKINIDQITNLVRRSDLTEDQKADIVGFKIVRGDRGTNKSIIAKGILRNVGMYTREDQTYYYPNYPYNDLDEDPFLNEINNAYSKISEAWLIICTADGEYIYTDPNTNKEVTKPMFAGQNYEFCAIGKPRQKTNGTALIGPANYNVWIASNANVRGYEAQWNDPFTNNNTEYKYTTSWVGGLFSGAGNAYARMVVEDLDGPGNDCNNETTFENPTNGTFRCGPRNTLIPYDINDPNLLPGGISPLGYIPFPTYNNGLGYSRRSSLNCNVETPIQPIKTPASQYRHVFNSPETSFGQPFLGNVLKLENVMYGAGIGHFVQVSKNAKYKLISKEAQIDALNSSTAIARITSFNATALFTAYQAYLTIYINGITRRNYAYSFNSIASYDYTADIENNPTLGIKQRTIDLTQYLIPGVQSVGDNYNINNYQRESSVFIKTIDTVSPLLFPSNVPSINPGGTTSATALIVDDSRFTISDSGACATPAQEQDLTVVSYYGSMKNVFDNQWGQIYSYETIDTGFQKTLPFSDVANATIFGGDTFINKFAFKTKLPFFIDNRVGAPDDSDIFYDEIGNIAYPKYWHSSRSILEDYSVPGEPVIMQNLISYKATNFDCPNNPADIVSVDGAGASLRTYYDGYFYLFAYGIPSFYCESSYNVDLRQAFDNKAGDFWPHVSTSIPDDWVQESFVSIAFDNTYTYNTTFSKQNKENVFTHLPPDWTEQLCYTNYPFRAIYSDAQTVDADNRVNNWLSYSALSYHDFPQNYGNLISLDGIQNRAVLARFENKSLLYNNLLTIDTSNPQAAYVGNPRMFENPPIDFAETDLGYAGSQNKFLLKIPQGQVSIDAKRGQVFLIGGDQAQDLSAFGSGMNRFFTDHLAFEILRYFPEVDTDNHFNGIGLHGVYDSKFDRVIISKLDYIPIDKDVKYDATNKQFYVESQLGEFTIRNQVYLTDSEFFCNKSWTLSFNMNTKSWVSFHSYIPNWYIGENNFFYSGINGCCDDFDSSFAAFVGNTNKLTTSTTTTNPGRPNYTTTTRYAPSCELDGSATELFCELDGEVEITVPATTTTTICSRPLGLIGFQLVEGYDDGINPPVVSTGSLFDACTAMELYYITTPTTTFGYTYSLEVGQFVYDDNGTLCTYIPTGYYFTEESAAAKFAYYIQDGFIMSIDYCDCGTTTTTTTSVPNIPECCGMLFASGDNIYYTLPNSIIMGGLLVPGYVASLGIAITANKLWSIDTTIEEWDIALSPFSATFNRSIAFPVGFTTSAGITAIDDVTLIAIDDTPSPQEVVELDVTGLTATSTSIITLQANRVGVGNTLYTTSGKLIVINYDSVTNDYYLTQYDYGTAAIELDLNIGTIAPTSIFQCNCYIYISEANGDTYLVTSSATHSMVNLDISVDAVTQLSSCVVSSLTDNPNLTTTTTTSTSSTTTTTTTIP